MKTCREVHEEATALLEGQLPLFTRLNVRMHLLLCVHCRRHIRHLRLLARTLAIRGRESTSPADFVERVIHRLECESRLPDPGEDTDSP